MITHRICGCFEHHLRAKLGFLEMFQFEDNNLLLFVASNRNFSFKYPLLVQIAIYLGICTKRHIHNEGSWNAMVQALVRELRRIRTQVSVDKIAEHMDYPRQLEAEIQVIDRGINAPLRAYISEIWQVLNVEPEPDDAHVYVVLEFITSEAGSFLSAPIETYYYRRAAIRWIKDKAPPNKQYIVQEVFRT